MACRGAGARVQAAAPLPPRGVAAAVHRTATGEAGCCCQVGGTASRAWHTEMWPTCSAQSEGSPVCLLTSRRPPALLLLPARRPGRPPPGTLRPCAACSHAAGIPAAAAAAHARRAGGHWVAVAISARRRRQPGRACLACLRVGTASAGHCDRGGMPGYAARAPEVQASTQREAQELQARMEAHDRLLCGPEQQQAADAPSAAQPSAPAPLPPTAVNTSPAGTVLPAGMVLPEVAEEFAKTAVACAKVAVAAEAAAEAARAAARDRPARSVWRATSLENAVDQWKQAALSWGSALDALQVARQLGPEVPAVAEAGAAVVAAFRLQRQRIEKEERKKRKSGLDG